MGLIVDTNVLIGFERRGKPADLSSLAAAESVFLSAVTVSELLMGVWRADSEARQARRSAFVEAVIGSIPA